jgi:hypothetical protein
MSEQVDARHARARIACARSSRCEIPHWCECGVCAFPGLGATYAAVFWVAIGVPIAVDAVAARRRARTVVAGWVLAVGVGRAAVRRLGRAHQRARHEDDHGGEGHTRRGAPLAVWGPVFPHLHTPETVSRCHVRRGHANLLPPPRHHKLLRTRNVRNSRRRKGPASTLPVRGRPETERERERARARAATQLFCDP